MRSEFRLCVLSFVLIGFPEANRRVAWLFSLGTIGGGSGVGR